ncbi:MAG: efflux RND transporter periplasmic adaptor subunit [Candidatus Aminicenantes bacterium]|nr:efflux RND transporter periplasmic adaptor subunit [Candidatus Aminicenantes bacterium]
MKKRIILGIFVIVVITGVVLSMTVFKNGKENEVVYKKEALKKGTVEALVVTTGTLNPVTIVDVGSQVSGKIKNLFVDFNSKVTAGMILVELDQELFLTRLQQNEANYNSRVASLEKSKVTLENTEKRHERTKDLFARELVSLEEMDSSEVAFFNAQADLKSAEASLAQAQSVLDTSKVDLTYTVIRSPIDGVVINRNINVGQTVAASLQAPVLFQIANDLAKMQVECGVDEADIGRVKEGQRVRFTVDAFPNDEFQGIVSQVRYSPVVQQNVVTYTTIVEVENPELKLMPGMTATISMITGEARNVLLVPNSALRFIPDLSAEEMRVLREEMLAGMEAGQQGTPSKKPASKEGGERTERQRPTGERSGMPVGMGRGGSQGTQIPRVWFEDENGKLKMIMIRTGVTDNTNTEVISGDLTEGQEIITGQTSNSDNRGRSSNPMGGGGNMMFMRR